MAQQAGAKVRGGIAPLAVRQARIVVLVPRPVIDKVAHQVCEIVEERGPKLGDQHGAGSVQAVGYDEAAVYRAALEGVSHLRGDVDGLPVRLARHRKGLPQHLQPVPLGRGHARKQHPSRGGGEIHDRLGIRRRGAANRNTARRIDSQAFRSGRV